MAKKLLTGLLVVLPALLAVSAFPFLPETIATHFRGGGADGWGPKWTMLAGAAVLVLVNAGMVALARYSRRDPARQKYLVVDGPMSPALCVGLLGVIDVAFGGYVATVLPPFDAVDLVASGRLFSWLAIGIALAFMLALAVYFLSGKGAKRTSTSGSPRPDGVPTKDDLLLSRTLGAFLLVVCCILAVAAFA